MRNINLGFSWVFHCPILGFLFFNSGNTGGRSSAFCACSGWPASVKGRLLCLAGRYGPRVQEQYQAGSLHFLEPVFCAFRQTYDIPHSIDNNARRTNARIKSRTSHEISLSPRGVHYVPKPYYQVKICCGSYNGLFNITGLFDCGPVVFSNQRLFSLRE